MLFAGLCFHTLTLGARWFEGGRLPITNLHESLSFLSWISVLAYAVIVYKYGLKVIGAFVAPFAFVFIVVAFLVPADMEPLRPMLDTYWLSVHIALAVSGNAFFALAFIFGLLYLVQNRHLKTHKLGGLYFALPSLEVIDELNYRCLSYGFPLLTLGIISGALWSQALIGEYWMWKHRQVWSLITWFLYAALLHGRLIRGWRGKKSAVFSVAGFLVLLASTLIIYLLLGEGHGFFNVMEDVTR